jgi:hypothetical protein
MVKSVCDRGVFLANGRIHTHGDVVDAINAYERWHHEEQGKNQFSSKTKSDEPGASAIDITGVDLLNSEGMRSDEFAWQDPIEVRVYFQAYEPVDKSNLVVHFVRADGTTSSGSRRRLWL